MSAGLRRSERLKSRKAIDRLFRTGQRVKHARFRILYRTDEGQGELRAAFAVPRKKVRKAHDRNRIRRLMKEAFRLRKEAFQELLKKKGIRIELFILFQGKEVPPWKEVEEEISGVMKRLEDALNSENGPSALGAGGS